MIRQLIGSTLVFGLLTGCATTIKKEWKDPKFAGPAARSVIVLCLPTDSKEKECEEDFLAVLKDEHITAVPGYTTSAAMATKEGAMAKARELGIPRVLVSRFIHKKTELDIYTPEPPMMLMGGPDWYFWEGPEYEEHEYQVFATALYDSATGKPIWSALSDTFLRSTVQKGMKSYAKSMVRRLEHQGLLAP